MAMRKTWVSQIIFLLGMFDSIRVELWFAKIERDVIARGVLTSVADLKKKLMRYIRKYNEEPQPVKWKYFDTSKRITPDLTVTVN